MFGSRENPQRTRLKPHPQIVDGLRRSQGALRKTDSNTELLTQPKEKVPRLHNLLERGSEDEAIIQIPQDPEDVTMHDRGDRDP